MSNLPIQFQDKINSPELLAFLQQFGEETYIDAELINKFRDAINELGLIASPDRMITLGTETKVDNVYTYQNYVWSLNNIEYTNTTPDALTIAPATTGFKRKDISVFTSNGTIEIVQGIETDGETVTTPEVPAGTLYFKFYDIDGVTIVDDTTTPIVGTEFVSKAEFKTYEDTISTGENVFILCNKGSNIDLKNSGLISIAGFNTLGRNTAEGIVYQGKQFTLRNLTGNPILIKHDQIATSVERPFLTKDGLDITFPNNEMIRFDYSSYGMREVFRSWGSGGDISGKEDTSNKSNSDTDIASTTKFPTWNAIWTKALSYFQPKLVSGTNIKTINGDSILGSGNLVVGGVGSDLGLLKLTDTPPPTGKHRGDVQIAGTYTNFGGIVFTQPELDNNYGYIYVDEGVSSKVLSAKKGVELSQELNPQGTTKAPSEKAVADLVSDIIIPANSLIPYTKLPTDGFLVNTGSFVASSGYFAVDFVPILDNSFKYSTRLGSNVPSVAIYDQNKILITAKNATQLTNTAHGFIERNLSDDFDLSNAKFVKISGTNTYEVVVKYPVNITKIPTLSVLDQNSEKPINSKSVKPIIDNVTSLQNQISLQKDLINNLDKSLEDLQISPLFYEMASTLTKGNLSAYGSTSTKIFSVISRDSDYQLTANTSDVSTLTSGIIYGIVIAEKVYRGVFNKTTGVFTSFDILPNTITSFSTLYDGNSSIHFSREGYKCMGRWFAERNLKYGKIKKTFGVYGLNSDIPQVDFVVGGVLKLQMQKLLGTEKTGGFIDGTKIGTFKIQPINGGTRISSKFSCQWRMNQNVVGTGVRFVLNTGINGFIRLVCGLSSDSENGVKILAKDQNGVTLYDQNQIIKGITEININISDSNTVVTFEISLLASVYTSFSIDQVEVFRTYKANENLFKDGDSVMFLMDSWGVFPSVQGEEVPIKRPDESSLQGLGYFPTRFKSYLAEQGKNVSIYNFSRGGQTSKWGDYWVETLLSRCPTKPKYCVVNFYINDTYSIGNVAGNTPSNYDFSPTDPYTLQLSDVGGVFGSVTKQQWFDNMRSICEKLILNGVQPIIISYPMFANFNLEFEQKNLMFLKDFDM